MIWNCYSSVRWYFQSDLLDQPLTSQELIPEIYVRDCQGPSTGITSSIWPARIWRFFASVVYDTSILYSTHGQVCFLQKELRVLRRSRGGKLSRKVEVALAVRVLDPDNVVNQRHLPPVEHDAAVLALVPDDVSQLLVHLLPVHVVAERLADVEAVEVVGDAVRQPRVRPLVHRDEAAEVLVGYRLAHHSPRLVGLVDDCRGVQETRAETHVRRKYDTL